jgi:hypothetical protein
MAFDGRALHREHWFQRDAISVELGRGALSIASERRLAPRSAAMPAAAFAASFSAARALEPPISLAFDFAAIEIRLTDARCKH